MKKLKICFSCMILLLGITGCIQQQTNSSKIDDVVGTVTPSITTTPEPTKENERPTNVSDVFYNNMITMDITGDYYGDDLDHSYFLHNPENLIYGGYYGTYNQIVSYYIIHFNYEEIFGDTNQLTVMVEVE